MAQPEPAPNGTVAEHCQAALLLVDTINDLEFEGGELLLPGAVAMAGRLADLKRRAKRDGIPAIYVNDNFGRWRSDFRQQVAHCLDDGVRGEPVARLLAPEDDDYFVLKPMNSAFHETPLDLLLRHLGARTLILTGVAANICVLFTANDAHMRGYRVIVPEDCVASETAGDTQHALRLMRDALSVEVCPAAELDLAALARG
jgi:nicotinamidase-related amidase